MDNELKILLEAITEAGEEVLSLQKSKLEINKKNNNSIVTQADFRANEILKTHLLKNFPNDGWLSEETVDDPSRLHCKRVWIVDPIDGTIEYAAGLPEYAISVALVENGIPMMSAVFNPATAQLFYAVKDKGAWLDDQPIHCKHFAAEISLLASRTEYERGEWDRFQQHLVKPIGSIAYKLALVAQGAAHATFSLGPKSEWDVAAGTLLVTEAGGVVTDKTGAPLVFNRSHVRINGIIAATAAINKEIFRI